MKKRGLILVLAMVTVLVSFSFSAVAEVGITDTEIHIGQWSCQTGPAAPWGVLARGSDAYFKMINDNGGIHGRKIVHHYFDDGYNPAKTKAGVKDLQEGTGMFAWVVGTGTAPGLAVREYLHDKKIPWVGPASGGAEWVTPPQKYLFAVYPLYYYGARSLCNYAVKNLKKKRIAVVYQNDSYVMNGVEGAETELKKFGMNLIAKIPVELKDTDMQSHVLELRRVKADVVLLWVSPTHALRIMGTARKMRLKPQWMTTSTLSDYKLMYKLSRGMFKGVISPAFSDMPDSGTPEIIKYKKEIFDKYAPKDRWGTFFIAGIGLAEPLVEGLKRAGRNLTREKLVTEMEKIKNFQGILGKISYDKFDKNDKTTRQGQKSNYLIKCMKGGKAKKLTDWIHY